MKGCCISCFFLLIFLSRFNVFAQEQVKLMAYNLLNYEGIPSDTAIRNPYFRTIMKSVKPDLLVCEEIVAYQGILGFVSHVMNDSADIYALGDFISGFDTDKAIIYRKDKFSFVSNYPIQTDLRDINEFTLVHKPGADTIRLYAVHLKSSSSASDEAQRALEVDSLRKRTNALPEGSNFIVCGDFNIYNTNEAAYQKLLQNNISDDGNVNDPITISGVYNNPAYAQYHTQSPRTRSFGGGVIGGMDDRFDMILFSNAMMEPGGITYVPGSTIAYGNDGNHYNDSINRPPNTAVSMEMANALHYASDHLPLLATIEFETTGIAAIEAMDIEITTYPNPFNEEIQFSFSEMPSSAIHFQLIDILGRVVDRKKFSYQKVVNYHAPVLPKGIYFYRMEVNGKYVEGKLVKE